MEGSNFNLENVPKFKSPEEEVAYLRAHIAEREKSLSGQGVEVNKKVLAHEAIREYKNIPHQDVMHQDAILKEVDSNELVLRLKPESHDNKMEELLGVLLSKGISAALNVVAKMRNPHVDDDFHRFLVQYLITTHKIPGLKESSPLFKSLNMKLFEITLPEPTEENKKGLKELLSSMEQFYAGMHSVGEGRQNFGRSHFTLEIALSDKSDQFVFYTAVPSDKAELFEKQLMGVHTRAKIIEMPDDYNIFAENSEVAASCANLAKNEIYPIKMYDALDYDPLNIILNVFSKMKKDGEGASIQFTICPQDDDIIKKFNIIRDDLKSGMSVQDAGNITRQFGK